MILQQFTFSNFRSFKSLNTINLEAARIKSEDKNLDEKNVIILNNNELALKTKSIYGANASGKSNALGALSLFVKIVTDSVKDPSVIYGLDTFELDPNSIDRDSFFEIVFNLEGVRYRYGFVILDYEIESEWLFYKDNARETQLFTRDNGTIKKVNSGKFQEGAIFLSLSKGEEEEAPSLKGQPLFLTTLASFGFGRISTLLIEAIKRIRVVRDHYSPIGRFNNVFKALENPEKKRFILDFLELSDFGITDLVVREAPWSTGNYEKEISNNSRSKTLQELYSIKPIYEDGKMIGEAQMSVSLNESEGTQKMIALSIYLYDIFKNGGVLVIDEFDAKLHPVLTRQIIAIFNSRHNKKGQLICTIHDTNILDKMLLRRDQIAFVSKDRLGESTLTDFVEYKGIRNQSSFEKDYLSGRYGAIPFLKNLDRIFSNF